MADRILMIVESPNKVKTLKQFLPSNYIVMACVGHIRSIKDGKGDANTGIHVDKNFEADYVVSAGKEEVVSKLKEQVKLASKVILATDPDREGEAIAWHLKETLKIPNNKYERVTYHEITKHAIEEALKHPRKIDMNLVHAARARQKLDKLVGYKLSPIARNNVDAKSVGRCQSAGLKLIVQREEEIENFKPETFYELYLHFTKNDVEFKAKYIGTVDKEIKTIKNKTEIDNIIKECEGKEFKICDITNKDSLEYPKPPFNTSSYQQEISKRLGIGINDAMSCAQKLFEGIDIDGEHVALITYIRTDDSTLAPEFIPVLKDFIVDCYGKEYYAPIKETKKSENSQEGHEGIRCIDLNLTAEDLSKYINNSRLVKVYDIIWKRTVQSSMKPAIYDNKIITIACGKHLFRMQFKNIKFKGFRLID